MSRTLLLRLLATGLLAGALLSGRLAVASAASLEDLLTGALTPSAAPALLGPITAAGRVGWECKPERAAAAGSWHEAELPPDGTQ
ncbi:MAG TPA: hypothetical protein VFE16_09475 [Candidatus Cybelea sp.]|nr:hypothetical protein [Candidatus Cybelea sp.]